MTRSSNSRINQRVTGNPKAEVALIEIKNENTESKEEKSSILNESIMCNKEMRKKLKKSISVLTSRVRRRKFLRWGARLMYASCLLGLSTPFIIGAEDQSLEGEFDSNHMNYFVNNMVLINGSCSQYITGLEWNPMLYAMGFRDLNSTLDFKTSCVNDDFSSASILTNCNDNLFLTSCAFAESCLSLFQKICSNILYNTSDMIGFSIAIFVFLMFIIVLEKKASDIGGIDVYCLREILCCISSVFNLDEHSQDQLQQVSQYYDLGLAVNDDLELTLPVLENMLNQVNGLNAQNKKIATKIVAAGKFGKSSSLSLFFDPKNLGEPKVLKQIFEFAGIIEVEESKRVVNKI